MKIVQILQKIFQIIYMFYNKIQKYIYLAADENQGKKQGLKLNSYVLYENVQVYWDFGINISTYLLLLYLMYKKLSLRYNIINILDNTSLTPIFSLSRVVFKLRFRFLILSIIINRYFFPASVK